MHDRPTGAPTPLFWTYMNLNGRCQTTIRPPTSGSDPSAPPDDEPFRILFRSSSQAEWRHDDEPAGPVSAVNSWLVPRRIRDRPQRSRSPARRGAGPGQPCCDCAERSHSQLCEIRTPTTPGIAVRLRPSLDDLPGRPALPKDPGDACKSSTAGGAIAAEAAKSATATAAALAAATALAAVAATTVSTAATHCEDFRDLHNRS